MNYEEYKRRLGANAVDISHYEREVEPLYMASGLDKDDFCAILRMQGGPRILQIAFGSTLTESRIRRYAKLLHRIDDLRGFLITGGVCTAVQEACRAEISRVCGELIAEGVVLNE